MARIIALLLVLVGHASAQWVPVSGVPNTSIPSLFASGDILHVGTDSSVVYSSFDQGRTWSRSNAVQDTPVYIDAITVFDNKLFAGTGGAGVFVSEDNGLTWIPKSNGLTGLGARTISGFVERNGVLYAGTQGAGVFVLQGDTWNPFGSLSTSLAGNVEFLGLKGDTLIAGAGGNGFIWFAPPNATDWQGVSVAPLQVDAMIIYSVTEFRGQLYVGSTYGIHRSTDGGATWTYCGYGVPGNRRMRLLPVGDVLYATVTSGDTRWYSSPTGEDWTYLERTTGAYTERVIHGKIYSARFDGLWTSDIRTSTPNLQVLPDFVVLAEHYPNPFHDRTAISYRLPMNAFVTLSVYDALGHKVEELLNEHQAEGRYLFYWAAKNHPAGHYYYELVGKYQGGLPFRVVRQMHLIKD